MNTPDYRGTLSRIHQAKQPHMYGHRCYDHQWYDSHMGVACPSLLNLNAISDDVLDTANMVHTAAHDRDLCKHIAEGMTGLQLDTVPMEEREGWITAAQMAVETLAALLDPEVQERAARLSQATARLSDG